MSGTTRPTVVFIHGLSLHPRSWDAWVQRFDQRGYPSTAPAWPGIADTVEATRANPNDIAGQGLEDITDRYRQLISGMERLPVVIGHSFGALIAEKLLEEEQAVAAVAIDAAQAKGRLPAPIALLRKELGVLRDPASRHQSIALSKEQFRDSFGNGLAGEESDALWEQWVIPAPGRPLFDEDTATFPGDTPTEIAADTTAHGPLLLVLSGPDRADAHAVEKAAAKQSRHSRSETDVLEFADRGHLLTLDARWTDVADDVLTWLDHHVPG